MLRPLECQRAFGQVLSYLDQRRETRPLLQEHYRGGFFTVLHEGEIAVPIFSVNWNSPSLVHLTESYRAYQAAERHLFRSDMLDFAYETTTEQQTNAGNAFRAFPYVFGFGGCRADVAGMLMLMTAVQVGAMTKTLARSRAHHLLHINQDVFWN